MQICHLALTLFTSIVVLLASVAADDAKSRRDLVFADFEGDDYGGWEATGKAFGTSPAQGTLPGQMPVSGFLGKGLVNSFLGGDGPTGKLTSPEFEVERKYIRFLIGGGGYERQTCLNLLIDGKVVRSATGPNTVSGGSEQLEPAAWDVHDLVGRTARLEIVDEASGGWGHLNVDHIVFTDARPVGTVRQAVRELVVDSPFLLFPVRNGAAKRQVTVSVDGQIERQFEIELADGDADWLAPLDVVAWAGKTIAVKVDKLPEDSRALASIRQSDKAAESSVLYRERLRPQLHFSARRGWLNDPNGLVFYQGRYHLFFQHNPYGWSWGNMHWGHAVAADLFHWQELGEALYPDRFGPMFSGSAVVDWQNTSGFGHEGQPPLVLLYTAAGQPTVQCLAYSNDGGKTFKKFGENPIVEQITSGNRDPKVIWHEPSRRWVMALYVERDKKHTIHFLTSPDLKQWTVTSYIEGFYECPDLFELPLDGETTKTKWVLTGASSEYQVGSFDGRRFVPETEKLPGHRGRGFYAAQTFSDVPASDGRRIQIGWLQAASPDMAFNQCMSLPLALSLKTTSDGPRLSWSPVAELTQLRGRKHARSDLALESGKATPIDGIQADLLDIELEIEPAQAQEIALDVRGVPIVYDTAKQELAVNGHRAPAPLRAGVVGLRIVVDRTSLEVFASDGLTYLPMPVIPPADNRTFSITAKGDGARLRACTIYEMRSIWP
ncbi:MAG TPA: glycoside hydrolase family 32 protein [Pirellulales bacterium]|nr:glycoside hydrolase family 32 protein [Pirellulales bacterium]